MRAFETPNWLSHGGSMVRRQVAQAFLDARRGRLDPEAVKELTRNHVNHPVHLPHGLSRGGREKRPFHTGFRAVVMDPAAGWMEVRGGNPGENPYRRFELKGPAAGGRASTRGKQARPPPRREFRNDHNPLREVTTWTRQNARSARRARSSTQAG
jgi:hypothetical protein